MVLARIALESEALSVINGAARQCTGTGAVVLTSIPPIVTSTMNCWPPIGQRAVAFEPYAVSGISGARV